MPLDANTWQRITLTALLLAHKMWDDDCLENREFADLFNHDHDARNALERKLAAMTHERDELRTVRQLGYVVACGARSVSRSRGLSVHVQSAVMAPPQLEAQVEEWLVGFRAGALAALTPAALAEYAEAVATNLEEPPKRLDEEAAPLWRAVVLQRPRGA